MMRANPSEKNVVSHRTAEDIFRAQALSGMWTSGRGYFVFETYDREMPYAVDDGKKARHEARRFASPAEALAAFPQLRAFCERRAAEPTWEDHFRAALVQAADVASCDISALCWEHANLDHTWGHLDGLVFWGASDECNKRAAQFFVEWMSRHGRAMNIVGGYERQASISFCGVRYYRRYAIGTPHWHDKPTSEYCKEEPIESRVGYAASYVYYPGAE